MSRLLMAAATALVAAGRRLARVRALLGRLLLVVLDSSARPVCLPGRLEDVRYRMSATLADRVGHAADDPACVVQVTPWPWLRPLLVLPDDMTPDEEEI